jgi:hypothetical protein
MELWRAKLCFRGARLRIYTIISNQRQPFPTDLPKEVRLSFAACYRARKARAFLQALLERLFPLHALAIAHRDLKPANLLRNGLALFISDPALAVFPTSVHGPAPSPGATSQHREGHPSSDQEERNLCYYELQEVQSCSAPLQRIKPQGRLLRSSLPSWRRFFQSSFDFETIQARTFSLGRSFLTTETLVQ